MSNDIRVIAPTPPGPVRRTAPAPRRPVATNAPAPSVKTAASQAPVMPLARPLPAGQPAKAQVRPSPAALPKKPFQGYLKTNIREFKRSVIYLTLPLALMWGAIDVADCYLALPLDSDRDVHALAGEWKHRRLELIHYLVPNKQRKLPQKRPKKKPLIER